MADMNLTQAEADALIAMEKHRANEERSDFPTGGQFLVLPLQSVDRREQFLLDLSRARIDLLKVKMQNRARQVVVLVRLDLGGAPHRNPDGEEVPVPHLHVYREGFGDKWAVPVPADRFTATRDVWRTLEEFLRFCNVTKPPLIEKGLFT
ncbi:MAG: hypothetical protein HYR85_01725 [Planctomycetes bacterium]|nr:hypothetical protein [Planctomycetota bacterium]MBI3845987.1 hypothetical protein [Planctomycetota bacterium]